MQSAHVQRFQKLLSTSCDVVTGCWPVSWVIYQQKKKQKPRCRLRWKYRRLCQTTFQTCLKWSPNHALHHLCALHHSSKCHGTCTKLHVTTNCTVLVSSTGMAGHTWYILGKQANNDSRISQNKCAKHYKHCQFCRLAQLAQDDLYSSKDNVEWVEINLQFDIAKSAHHQDRHDSTWAHVERYGTELVHNMQLAMKPHLAGLILGRVTMTTIDTLYEPVDTPYWCYVNTPLLIAKA